jgi:hypothetical protein
VIKNEGLHLHWTLEKASAARQHPLRLTSLPFNHALTQIETGNLNT